MSLKLCGRNLVDGGLFIDARLNAAELESAINPATKWIVLIYFAFPPNQCH